MTFSSQCKTTAESLETFALRAAERKEPVIRQLKMATLAKRLDLDRLIREGGLSDGGLDEFLEGYLAGATQLHHPGFMGHQVAVPHPLGAIAALINASTNNAMNIYEMGPSAATVEFAVVNWMLQKIGWVCAPMPRLL